MAWGPFMALLLRALPDLLFLWRHRVAQQDREAMHEDVQEFREALVGEQGGGVDLDRAAELLERRVREARELREQRA